MAYSTSTPQIIVAGSTIKYLELTVPTGTSVSFNVGVNGSSVLYYDIPISEVINVNYTLPILLHQSMTAMASEAVAGTSVVTPQGNYITFPTNTTVRYHTKNTSAEGITLYLLLVEFNPTDFLEPIQLGFFNRDLPNSTTNTHGTYDFDLPAPLIDYTKAKVLTTNRNTIMSFSGAAGVATWWEDVPVDQDTIRLNHVQSNNGETNNAFLPYAILPFK